MASLRGHNIKEHKMWKIGGGLLLFFYGCFAFAGNNHNVLIDGGIVFLRGALVAPACEVSTENKTQVVDMGVIRSNQFSGAGSDAIPVPFYINLTNCTTVISQNVKFTFVGEVDKRNPNIFKNISKSNAAKGVGIALFTPNGEQILPNVLYGEKLYIHDGHNNLQFVAKFRATEPQVIGGKAEATTWFSLTYP